MHSDANKELYLEWERVQALYAKLRHTMDDPSYNEFHGTYLVELQSLHNPDVRHIVLTEGRTALEASFRAFGTRNVPNNWKTLRIDKVS